jgi:hypothetical protein
LRDAVGCELGFAVGGGLSGAAVGIEELLSGFDVPCSEEDHGESGELECVGDVREATTKKMNEYSPKWREKKHIQTYD